jgi:hypothetical protein
MPLATLPPPIPAYEEGSFAAFTVQRRLPKILADVKRELRERHRADPRWEALETAITCGALIDVTLLASDTPYWAARRAALSGRTWFEQSFFDLEFFFYKAIDTVARDLEPELDVFASTRRSALKDALPRVARTFEFAGTPPLAEVLLLAVRGNEADLSQLATNEGLPASAVLLDERAEILTALAQAGSSSVVQILADNAGSELCFDLLLVGILLENGIATVELQVKPSPMFVSDALAQDVEETVHAFTSQSPMSTLGRTGRFLEAALRSERLRVRAPRDWAEPRHMDELEPELARALSSAHLVLAKGDLNSRRYLGDRAWPAHTPVAEASRVSDQCAYALRVLKSDCVVGIPADLVEELSASEPNWRNNGRHSVIQRIDGASGRLPVRDNNVVRSGVFLD